MENERNSIHPYGNWDTEISTILLTAYSEPVEQHQYLYLEPSPEIKKYICKWVW